ncbi:MAG: hypothetical protein NTW95_07095 [Candidatus Aminicenantes bacterium]|nr:hypothetical protein [Candidatus Aminicenantes bacterium]
MELEIDFAIAGKYGDYHDCYARNLKIFKRFIKVFDIFFKKQKYENSQVVIDPDAKNRATIRFCARNYQLGLSLDPAELDRALVKLEAMGEERPLELARATIVKSESVVFPGEKSVSLQDDYEFNNAVLNFFIRAISKNSVETAAARKSPARK